MQVVCKFEFPMWQNPEIIEAHLASAIVAAEYVFGQPKVRINGGYFLSKAQKSQGTTKVVIDVTTEVGEHIAQVFTGMMIRHFGEDTFTVERKYAQTIKG